MRIACVALLLLALDEVRAGAADPDFINDEAGLLQTGERQRIGAMHRALLKDVDIHFHLTVLKSAQKDLDMAAVDIFERLQLGTRGMLLLVDPAGEAVRLEVGYDLESVFTDLFVGYVEREQMAPFFKAGRIGAGVEATVELLVGRAEGRLDTSGTAPRLTQGSGGGGARIRIGAGGSQGGTAVVETPGSYGPGQSPEDALTTYRRVLASRIKDPHLPLYTSETRRFLSTWLVTDAQQANELRLLERHLSSARTMTAGQLAVVRFPAEARELPPYLFNRGTQGWELDLAAMSRLIRFNHRNQWHFATADHPYRFAFAGERFDRNGFRLTR